VSEKNIVMKVKKGADENIVVKTEKMNKMAQPFSPDLLLQMPLLPPLTVWIAQWWAGCSATKGAL
jgi:hypothetical protein